MEKKKLNLETTLKKATIEMLLLNLLKEQDMYGYQLSQELKKRSSGLYTILEGSMYPILYRLNDSGYISFFEKKKSADAKHAFITIWKTTVLCT